MLGLGALNKAEFINHGGQDILDSFTPKKTRQVGGGRGRGERGRGVQGYQKQ